MTKRWLWTGAAGITFAVAAMAQAQEPGDVLFHKEIRVVAGPMADQSGSAGAIMYHQAAGPMTMDFIGAEMSFGDKTVKNAPYAADAVTETTQTLSDGNRITRRSTASLSRDSQGRTRREESLAAIGPWATAGNPPKHVFINDPVTEVSYMLDPQTHTAQKLLMVKDKFMVTGNAGPGMQVFGMRHGGPAPAPEGKAGVAVAEGTFDMPIPKGAAPDIKTESLGKQTIEGVEAEGTRSTITIPAGAIGNEQPIQSTSERWYSSELQTIVMTKRSDPRFGETVYRLTNIQRGEQSQTLFEVPSDYAVKDDMNIMNEKMNHARKLADEGK
jgi:hypothetical protein